MKAIWINADPYNKKQVAKEMAKWEKPKRNWPKTLLLEAAGAAIIVAWIVLLT